MFLTELNHVPRAFWIGILLVVIVWVYKVAIHWNDEMEFTDADYAQYILHAKALGTGKPYTEIGYIYNDYNPGLGPKAYPPGLPMIIAPVYGVYDINLETVKPVMLVFSIIWLLTTVFYFSEVDRWLGLGVGVFMAGGTWFARNSIQLNSEIVFASLIWLIFLFMKKNNPLNYRTFVIVAILGSFSILVRAIGIALIPAMIVFCGVHYRQLGLRPLAFVIFWAATYVGMNYWVPVSGSYVGRNTLDIPILVKTALENLFLYRLAVFSAVLYPFEHNVVNDIYHIFAVLSIFLGLAVWTRENRRNIIFLFAVFYIGVLLKFGSVTVRYLYPLFPLVIFLFLVGMFHLTSRVLPPKLKKFASVVVLASTIMVVLGSSLNSSRIAGPRNFVSYPEVQEMFDWIRKNLNEDARLMFVRPRLLTWQTAISAMSTFRAPRDEMLGYLSKKRITHVITGDLSLDTEANDALQELIKHYPDRFRLLFGNEEFAIFRFQQSIDDSTN